MQEASTDVISLPSEESQKARRFKDKLTSIAVKQLHASTEFKKPIIAKIKRYEDLYANKVPKKLRIQFNVPVPVFAGMLDQFMADFDEPINALLEAQHPSDYFKAEKIKAAFDQEKDSPDPAAMWDYKSRIDKKLAIFSGRGIMKYYATSDPEYKSHLDNVDYNDFHCQPAGGGILENHIFCGQEGIVRGMSKIKDGVEKGWYDQEQVAKLSERSGNKEYLSRMADRHSESMNRFRAFGLDPDSNNYVGEATFNLCEWYLTYKGTRYYLLFEPYTETWLRCEKLTDVYPDNLYPYVTWATHEDNKVFWSKSVADDIYPIADAVITLFNQDLTNREKRNLGARAYDKDMFPDVAKLDAAQYRADALVPADTAGGTKKIAEGIYRFDTPELQGTVNLIDWMIDTTGRQVGVSDTKQGATREPSKRVGVVYTEQSNIAKRIGYRSQAWTGMWAELITRYIHGLEEHMPQTMAIKVLGDLGFEWDELKREDLKLKKPLGIKIISTTYQKQQSEKRKESRAEAMKLITSNKALLGNVNPEWMTEEILRLGEYDDDEIKRALDTKSFASRESVARAHAAIQDILLGKKPYMNYSADTTFMKIITQYAMDHRVKLGVEKFTALMQFSQAHAEIVATNMASMVSEMGRSAIMSSLMSPEAQAKGGAPGAAPADNAAMMPTPNPTPTVTAQ